MGVGCPRCLRPQDLPPPHGQPEVFPQDLHNILFLKWFVLALTAISNNSGAKIAGQYISSNTQLRYDIDIKTQTAPTNYVNNQTVFNQKNVTIKFKVRINYQETQLFYSF